MSRRDRKKDQRLGMNRAITRRDFIHDSGLAALGLTLPAAAVTGAESVARDTRYYPPTLTGLRGSHKGAFEAAHALALDGKTFGEPQNTGERYDLVVVGGGISGLSTAIYYRQLFGDQSRILILENHDDFGGHAKRNEFHHGGEMRLAQGGVQNLEIHSFSDTVNAMMERLGIDLQKVAGQSDFAYGYENAPGVPAIWFDQENYGKNVLVKDFNAYEEDGRRAARAVEEMPLGEASRERLKAFYLARKDVFAGQDWPAKEAQLQAVSYFDFLREHGGLDDECLGIFNNILHDAAGFGTVNLSAMEALYFGMPGWQLLGEEQVAMDYDYPSAMFPDGNASVARLMVLNLIPAVSPGTDAENVALADFDYATLDRETSSVRLRLNATVVHVANERDEVAVRYVRDGQLLQVQARHAVLACYHSVIPHLCPSLPEAQLEALRYQVKHPLLVTNVQIRSAGPLLEAGVSTVHCPGRLHAEIHLWQGNTAGGYSQGSWDALDGPVNLAFWGSIKEPPGDLTLKQRLRGSRAKMLALEFEDYEREVRTVLDGLLGPYGFDVQKDILAITVNRWPHGYAYWYTDLWDEEFEEGQYPHEIARQRFGNIAIANADASAQAYTHTAIEQAWRAVRELRYA